MNPTSENDPHIELHDTHAAFVKSTATRLARAYLDDRNLEDPTLADDVAGEMWEGLYTAFAEKPSATVSYLRDAAFRAARRFLCSIYRDGPHDKHGTRDPGRMTQLPTRLDPS